MRVYFLIIAALSIVASVYGDAQLQFSGPDYVNPSSGGSTQLSGSGLSAVLSSLLNLKPSAAVDAATSQQVEEVVRPNIFSRPQAVFSAQVMDRPGGASAKHFAAGEGAHAAALQGAGSAAAAQQVMQALTRVAAAGVGSGALVHRPIGQAAIPGCSDLCMEELLKDALKVVGSDLTSPGGPLKGSVSLPAADGVVALSLQGMAVRLWGLEMAVLAHAGTDLDEQRQRGAVAADSTPVLYDAALLSPRALGDSFGVASPEADAAIGALSALVSRVQQSLAALHDGRLATHIAVVDDVPVRGSSVKAVLEWRESQQRRHLLAFGPAQAAATAWTVGSAAWISAILFLVFGLVACQVLAKMEFKQDSLLYSRAKTE